MEKNKHGYISEKELDNLLSEAFLNLDFESNSENKEALAIVAKQAMHRNSLYSFFTSHRFNLLFFLLSFLLFLTSLYRYADPVVSLENKRTDSVLQDRGGEKKSVPVIVSGKVTPAKISFAVYKNGSGLTGTPAKKDKVESANKKDEPGIIPIDQARVTLTDSLSKTENPAEIKAEASFFQVSGLDSGSFQKSQPVIASAWKVKNPKTSEKIKTPRSETKVKVGKRRKGRLFGRATKVRRKGSKFLKDSGRR